jgi:hypothetical protein
VRPTLAFVVHVGCKGYLRKIQKITSLCFLTHQKGSPEGAVNNEVASEIGSSNSLEGFKIRNSLEAFRLPENPLLSVVQDPQLLQINSSGDIVVEEYIEVPTGPNTESGVDDPLFQSESFITPVHTAGIFNPSSVPVHSVWGTSSDTIFLTH